VRVEADGFRYRQVIFPDFPKHLVTIKFILGTPAYPEKPIGEEAINRSKLLARVKAEAQEHSDMVILPVSGIRA
jgi:hypothetical protein